MSDYKQKRIWVTWEVQIRNKTLSNAVGAELFEIISAYPRYIKYPLNIYNTLSIFYLHKPDIIFVQNPSFVLAVISVIFGKLRSVPVIVDSHNAGVFPLDGKSSLLNRLAILLARITDITLVSNAYLAEYLICNGGRAQIMPDPLPVFDNKNCTIDDPVKKDALFVCTWAEDEPYLELIKAAKLIDSEIKIHVTGNPKSKLKNLMDKIPANIVLTGYLSDSDYKKMLSSCDIVIDLTNRENCLVCGAYEAVAMEKPLIVSDTVALKEYFYQGTVYTDNSASNIADSIRTAYQNLDRLRIEVRQLKSEIKIAWPEYLQQLESRLKQCISNNAG